MVLLIKREEVEENKINGDYSIFSVLKKGLSKNVSLSIAKSKGHIEITRNMRSDRIYYVTEGQLRVTVGPESFIADAGDLIFIPKRTPYHFDGVFKAVLIDTPAFDQRTEVTIRRLR